MEISGTKTEIMHQKKRNDTYSSPKFYLGNHELKLVSNFKYLVQFSLQLLQKMLVTTWKVIWFAFSKFKNILKCKKLF